MSVWIWLLAVVLAVFVGNVVGEVISASLPAFARVLSLGFDATTVNLIDFIELTVGFRLSLNPGGALAGLIAILTLPR